MAGQSSSALSRVLLRPLGNDFVFRETDIDFWSCTNVRCCSSATIAVVPSTAAVTDGLQVAAAAAAQFLAAGGGLTVATATRSSRRIRILPMCPRYWSRCTRFTGSDPTTDRSHLQTLATVGDSALYLHNLDICHGLPYLTWRLSCVFVYSVW